MPNINSKPLSRWWLKSPPPESHPVIREAMAAADAAPPLPSTLVGGVVTNINRALQNFRNQETILIAECAAKTEALRQTRAAIKSMELALTEICDDPALTDDERAVASEPFNRSVVEPMERDLYIELAEAVANG